MESELNKIIDAFNKNLSQLFKLAKKIDPGNKDLHFYNNKFILAKQFQPAAVLERNIDAFWNNKDLILDKNVDYFLKLENFVYEDENEREIYRKNMECGQQILDRITESELLCIWNYLNNMLESVIQYKLLKNEYKATKIAKKEEKIKKKELKKEEKIAKNEEKKKAKELKKRN